MQMFRCTSCGWGHCEIFFGTRGNKGEYAYLRCTVRVSRGQLGEYGYFTNSGSFCSKGNIFSHIKSRDPEADIIPRRPQVTMNASKSLVVDGLSLPSNHAFNSSLVSLSSQLTNAYLVTMTVQCTPKGKSTSICPMFGVIISLASDNLGTTNLCTFAKPFVWHRGDETDTP